MFKKDEFLQHLSEGVDTDDKSSIEVFYDTAVECGYIIPFKISGVDTGEVMWSDQAYADFTWEYDAHGNPYTVDIAGMYYGIMGREQWHKAAIMSA